MSEHTESTLRQDFALELEQFHSETRARPDELAAIRRRLRTAKSPQKAPPLRLLSMGLLATAAAGLILTVWLPDDPVPVQQLALSAEDWSEVQASEDVLLSFAGQGDLRAEGKVHDIDWSLGRLNVSVTPEQGVDLTVRTPEAEVSVVGTVFEVRRDRLGTTVSVERGKVSVSCSEGEPMLLIADDVYTCLPTTAMGLLNRALDLKSTDPDAALKAIEMGLERAESSDSDDLHYRAAEIHREAGRPEAALASAQAALGGDATYAREAHLLAAHQALTMGSCDSALPHLQWMAEQNHAAAEDLAALAQCVSKTDPEAERKWLEEAEARATDPGLKEKIRSRIDRLDR